MVIPSHFIFFLSIVSVFLCPDYLTLFVLASSGSRRNRQDLKKNHIDKKMFDLILSAISNHFFLVTMQVFKKKALQPLPSMQESQSCSQEISECSHYNWLAISETQQQQYWRSRERSQNFEHFFLTTPCVLHYQILSVCLSTLISVILFVQQLCFCYLSSSLSEMWSEWWDWLCGLVVRLRWELNCSTCSPSWFSLIKQVMSSILHGYKVWQFYYPCA